jgi:hypothetical protein
MKNLKINTEETTVTTEDEEVVLNENSAVQADRLAAFEGRCPADWIIVPSDEERIQARNSNTGEVFEGTLAEFNKRLH